MKKKSTPPEGKASERSIRYTLNTVKRAMRSPEVKPGQLLKLLDYRDALLRELATVTAEKKKREAEEVKARIAELKAADVQART
jgi:hypothetical protein